MLKDLDYLQPATCGLYDQHVPPYLGTLPCILLSYRFPIVGICSIQKGEVKQIHSHWQVASVIPELVGTGVGKDEPETSSLPPLGCSLPKHPCGQCGSIWDLSPGFRSAFVKSVADFPANSPFHFRCWASGRHPLLYWPSLLQLFQQPCAIGSPFKSWLTRRHR